MKKLFYILVLFAGIANAQIVNIPDANFKARLITYGVDTNADGNIQVSEALAINSLGIPYASISDLTGIESFTNLTILDCNHNSISTLDLTALTSLVEVTCNDNQLTSLNVSGLTALGRVDCSNNLLTSLDLSSATSLGQLWCYNNQLTTLLFNCPATLGSLYCNSNQLTSINVTGYNALSQLKCSSNQLTSLDVSGIPYLITLYCFDNPLTYLNFTNCGSLDDISCGGALLTSLDLTGLPLNVATLDCSYSLISSFIAPSVIRISDFICNNNQLTTLDLSKIRVQGGGNFSNNPLQSIFMKNGVTDGINSAYFSSIPLQFVCADDTEIVSIRNLFTSWGYPNVVVNSYCTFTPGGNYNTITGTMTFDANNDGCDVTDLPKSNVRENINDGTNYGASFTNGAGNYAFYTQAGSFDITPSIENPSWFTFSPPSATIPFANNNNNTTTQNFCITANGIHPDIEVVIAPIARAQPGFDAQYKIVYKNKGNQTLSGNVTFGYNDAVLDFISSTVSPSLQSTGLLTYDYTNLLPFENRSFYITLHVNAPTDTPAVNIGDVLNFTATINPIAGDENPSDNTFQYNQTVVGSYDPNDITCIEGNVVSPAEIGNYLHYVINFENTGTADAQNIVVRDVIDTTQFDVNSLQVLNSSDPVQAKLTGNIAEFIFQNINLHSGGHGNILIKVKSKNTLVQGSTVSKKAKIYFDYNSPIDTNMENTTFQQLSNPDFDVDASILVYPNPTKGNVTISCNNSINSVQLYDVQGRLLQTNLVNESKTTIDISNQSSGIYFIKVLSDKGIVIQKIVKE